MRPTPTHLRTPPLRRPRMIPKVPRLSGLLGLGLLFFAPLAEAAEVVFDGSYRARARWFDSLSIDRDLAQSEGSVAYIQHRLWLRPRFLITDQISANVEILGFNNVLWGQRPGFTDDPTALGTGFEDVLTAPASSVGDHLLDFTLWRAWGDIDTELGRFTFGRMPLHWGAGIWQNDGMSRQAHMSDYGDTVDRVQWELLVQDQIFIQAAFDLHDAGFLNLNDGSYSFNLVAAYRSETVVTGLNARVRRSPRNDFNLVTLDAALDATLGPLNVVAEAVAQFGGGELEGIAEVNVMAFGGVLEASLDLAPWRLELMGGAATGDANPNDERIRTFTFDRDYNIGLILFNQSMPTLAQAVPTEATGSRSFEFAQTGNAVNNALFVRPQLSRQIVPGLEGTVGLLAARAARIPEFLEDRGPNYGLEFNLGARFFGIEHLDVMAMGAVFLPGNFYGGLTAPGFEEADFDDPVFGAQLSTRVFF